MKWMKKLFHRFIIDENGAVTIYAIVITLLLFIFNAVLIDFIRIMVAERDTDKAAKAAVRSVMSAYNKDVKAYGLFGLNGENANDEFKKVLDENLKQEGDYFRFVDTKPEESKVVLNDNRMLSNKTTFEYQVLEEMKYIAPMEIGKSIIEGFLAVSEAMEQASTYADIATSIQDDVDKREDLLDKVKSKLEIAKQRNDELKKIVQDPPSSDGKFPIVRNMKDMLKHLNKYKEIKEREGDDESDKDDDSDKEDDEKEKRKQDQKDAKTYEKRVKELVETFELKSNAIREELKEAKELLEQAEELNKTVKKTIDDKRKENQENYSNANEAANMRENDRGNANGALNNIEEANKKLDDYVIDDEFFNKLKRKINLAIDEVETGNNTNLAGYINKLKEKVNGSGLYQDTYGVASIADKLRAHHNLLTDLLEDALAIISGDRPKIKDEEVEQKEEEAEENLDKVNEELDKALEDAEKYSKDNELLQEIANLVAKYKGSIENSKNEFNREDPDKVAKDAMSFVDKVFNALGDALINSRDKAYLNEYILTKFKSHDFSVKGADGMSLDNNQVEYIMYGLNSTGANFSAAMTELFAFRFAVNFVEAFTQQSVRSFGPYMWVAALAYALEQTVVDLIDIKNGKPIKFFEGINFFTTYKDYLRIFLFLHPEGNKTARTMALIDQDTGSDLTELPTYISGQVETSVKLWFLPGITKMLGKTGILNGKVDGNRFLINKKVDYSY